MSMQEQAVQMINDLSDENVKYLIDFMQRFMMPKSDRERERFLLSKHQEKGILCRRWRICG